MQYTGSELSYLQGIGSRSIPYYASWSPWKDSINPSASSLASTSYQYDTSKRLAFVGMVCVFILCVQLRSQSVLPLQTMGGCVFALQIAVCHVWSPYCQWHWWHSRCVGKRRVCTLHPLFETLPLSINAKDHIYHYTWQQAVVKLMLEDRFV